MLFRALFVCLLALNSVELKKTEPLKITFNIDMNENDTIVCDHDRDHIENHTYTVLEGEHYKLQFNHPALLPYSYIEKYHIIIPPNFDMMHQTEFKVNKDMGNVWQVLIKAAIDTRMKHKKGTTDKINGIKYSATVCYMRLHVRRKESPQTILVNNMALQPVRTDLSEKNIDLTAVYEYADGDMVSVTCSRPNQTLDSLGSVHLSLKHTYPDQLSDVFKSINLSSESWVGFRAKLYSRHNNTEFICMYQEATDYTTVMVKFITRKNFNNFIRVAINGLIIRPKIIETKPDYHFYGINYKPYFKAKPFVLVCEVVNNLTQISVEMFKRKKQVIEMAVTEKRAELKVIKGTNFYTTCAANFKHNKSTTEVVAFNYTASDQLTDECPLFLELSSNGTVTELYEGFESKVTYYEFEEGETLTLNCHGFCIPGLVIYHQLDGVDEHINRKNITKTLRLTRQSENTVSICKLMELEPDGKSTVMRQHKVVFRIKQIKQDVTTTLKVTSSYEWAVITSSAVAVIIISIICAIHFIKKGFVTKPNRARLPLPPIDPETPFYLNLLPIPDSQNDGEVSRQNEQHLDLNYDEVYSHRN